MKTQIWLWKRRKRERRTGLFRLSISPLGDGEMDFLTRKGFSLIRFLQAVSDQVGAYVGVGDICHPRWTPERHRRVRSHFLWWLLVAAKNTDCRNIGERSSSSSLFSKKWPMRPFIYIFYVFGFGPLGSASLDLPFDLWL